MKSAPITMSQNSTQLLLLAMLVLHLLAPSIFLVNFLNYQIGVTLFEVEISYLFYKPP